MLYICRKTAIVHFDPTSRHSTRKRQLSTSALRTGVILPLGVLNLLRNGILVEPTRSTTYVAGSFPASAGYARITHVQICECSAAIDFMQLSQQLPNLSTLECRDIDIDQHQTIGFQAMKLTSLLIFDCRADGIALSNLVMGSPILAKLFVAGGYDLKVGDLWLRDTPRPRFSANLRKLYLNLIGWSESLHFLIWARSTPTIPVVHLSVRVSGRNLPVFDLILSKCRSTVKCLAIFIQDDEWRRTDAGLLRLNVNDIPSLSRLRIMSHVAVLAEVVLNVRRLDPIQPVEEIDIFVIVPSAHEDLRPFADIDAMYRYRQLPALRMCTVKLFTVGDAVESGNSAAYTALVDSLFANLKADSRLSFTLMPLAAYITEAGTAHMV